MSPSLFFLLIALLIPLSAVVAYYDVRYRRIPNLIVLITLISGFIINALFGHLDGVITSAGGMALAFGLMLLPHIFGAMGAGDVKLFAALGAVLGSKLILPAFFVVVLVGGLLAIYTILRSKTARGTIHGVLQIFAGIFFGWSIPRFAKPTDRRHSIPYGVAITFGSLITIVAFGS